MSIAIAAVAKSTSVSTSALEEEKLARCFLSYEDFSQTRCMKNLLQEHADADKAPIISDKDVCGNDRAFGQKLVTELRRRMQAVSATGYITFSVKYGLQYHESLTPVMELSLISRCSRPCGS